MQKVLKALERNCCAELAIIVRWSWSEEAGEEMKRFEFSLQLSSRLPLRIWVHQLMFPLPRCPISQRQL